MPHTKPHRVWEFVEFFKSRDEILAATMDSLRTRINEVFDTLTEDELASLSQGKNPTTGLIEQYPVRLAKVILLAVGEGVINKAWNAESLKPKVTQVKRIMAKRPH